MFANFKIKTNLFRKYLKDNRIYINIDYKSIRNNLLTLDTQLFILLFALVGIALSFYFNFPSYEDYQEVSYYVLLPFCIFCLIILLAIYYSYSKLNTQKSGCSLSVVFILSFLCSMIDNKTYIKVICSIMSLCSSFIFCDYIVNIQDKSFVNALSYLALEAVANILIIGYSIELAAISLMMVAFASFIGETDFSKVPELQENT